MYISILTSDECHLVDGRSFAVGTESGFLQASMDKMSLVSTEIDDRLKCCLPSGSCKVAGYLHKYLSTRRVLKCMDKENMDALQNRISTEKVDPNLHM